MEGQNSSYEAVSDFPHRSQQGPFEIDIEKTLSSDSYLRNNTVQNYAWKDITVTVKDHKTKRPKTILQDVSGIVEAGEICALMGPSGSGKTTLLNVLAQRRYASAGDTFVNGSSPAIGDFRRMTSFVEQEDALIGCLTVRETLHFASRLSHKNALSKSERVQQIEGLLVTFGLRNQAQTIIGTPIQKGISGGQKRRTSVAAQLITAPKILFLDEPTSGLDSAASYEVISYIKQISKANNLIVIASIHQPSTSTFQLFDKLLLLSAGRPHYFGTINGVEAQFASMGCPIPTHTNPAEYLLEQLNLDFVGHEASSAHQRLARLQSAWTSSSKALELNAAIEAAVTRSSPLASTRSSGAFFFTLLMTLVHRSFIKSYRDVTSYGVRFLMYGGLAVMMGTIWLRLSPVQESIQPFINAIFFGSAFMSFMAVAYIPAFLEDRATYLKERENGLYGPTAFVIANTLIGLPYLFLISLMFSLVAYWLSNFQPTAHAFFIWVMWLFLDLIAAESLVVLVSSIFPNFVVSLALTAFANGLWMSVGGFMVSPKLLNVFWRYVFHYIDYQTYVFQGMMVNEFQDRVYGCGSGCECMYQSELAGVCKIPGMAVLNGYGYETGNVGVWVGKLLVIVLGYRLLGWFALWVRR